MASKNKLLGSGNPEEDEIVVSKEIDESFSPLLMYSTEVIEGRVVRSLIEFTRLVKMGWKDHPGKVTRLPGHEALYDAEHETDAETTS